MRLWVNADSAVLAPVGLVFLALIISVFMFFQDLKFTGWRVRKILNHLAIPVAISLFYFAGAHLNPLWIRVYSSSLWIENTYGFMLSKRVNLDNITNVYTVSRWTSGRGSYPYYSIIIIDNRGYWCEVGRAGNRSQLIPVRDQLIQLLEARGVKVSSERTPDK